MYKAGILVCGILISQQCVPLVDTLGPYKTVAACEDRIAEMVVVATAALKEKGYQEVTVPATLCQSDVKQSKV